MGIPVYRRLCDGVADLFPCLEALLFESQRAQNLSPLINQVQVGSELGLEDELPAQIGEQEQQHISHPMDIQTVQASVDSLDLRWDPVIYLRFPSFLALSKSWTSDTSFLRCPILLTKSLVVTNHKDS